MDRLVLKFGGTSVGDIERIRRVARIVAEQKRAGHEVAVVVSAMAGKTNELVALTDEVSAGAEVKVACDDEYDVVVSSAEQVSAGLLAMTLRSIGMPARSWLGWQLPIRTDDAHGRARIEDVCPDHLLETLKAGEIPVVAGFQGIDRHDRLSTLGRGAGDLSAVAVAAALKADRCDIYTDQPGVFTTDPRIVSKAQMLDRISYEEMLEMASLGAKVLQARSVELAMTQGVRLRVLSSFVEPGAPNPGTIVCDEEEIVEKHVVSGVAYSRDEAKITLIGVEDHPGVAADIFGTLADANINVDMIVQSESRQPGRQNIVFTAPDREAARAQEVLAAARAKIGYEDIHIRRDVAKVSVIGIGMKSHVGVARTMFASLAAKGINIEAIATSEIKISVLIDAQYTELAVRALHTAYGLDAA
jgi:aspartate kinase